MNVRHRKSSVFSEVTNPPRRTTVDHNSARETTNFRAFSIYTRTSAYQFMIRTSGKLGSLSWHQLIGNMSSLGRRIGETAILLTNLQIDPYETE
ncbi:hypothetical protein PVAP13_1NG215828 [Panicum virgatum]|uniref:Uncharacterized protein n=1 Tax=Panicum virgatum TaxID=38727 RepID=A0A8T0WPD8_PANVG|nr:hypothetical protein PVAP13_1NG215828 [Panicum virgatum]